MANKAKNDEETEEPEEGEENEDDAEGGGEEDAGPPTFLEKAATAFSALLVLGILAVLVRDAFHHAAPAAFRVTTSAGQMIGESYRIPIEVHNTGDEAARDVVVHVELRAADSVLAEGDLTVDWLPGRSSHKVVGVFEKPGVAHTVKADVRGFTEP